MSITITIEPQSLVEAYQGVFRAVVEVPDDMRMGFAHVGLAKYIPAAVYRSGTTPNKAIRRALEALFSDLVAHVARLERELVATRNAMLEIEQARYRIVDLNKEETSPARPNVASPVGTPRASTR